MHQRRSQFSRRRFLGRSVAAATAAWFVPHFIPSGRAAGSANERLNLAFIGAGGRGRANLNGLASENVVALCDVDEGKAASAFADYPQVKRYRDFRKMLDEVDGQIDAVVVSTPDHTHAVAAIDAIRRGKHVFCEKPLAHSIGEVRALQKAATEHNIVTQLGNQGHSSDQIRMLCEWIWDGAIGPVHTVHCLRPGSYSRIGQLASLSEEHAVPESLDWDLWLGPAAERPYHPSFQRSWRGWMPFGTGTIGDWVCHVVDPAFWALDLGSPTSVVAETDGYDPERHALTFPRGTHVTYEFAAKGDRGPVTLHWYDGTLAPPRLDEYAWREFPDNTCGLLLGTDGAIRHASHGAGGVRIMPEEKMRAYERPRPTLPRVPNQNHYVDWLQAIRNGTQAGSNFDYGGPLTEIALLGVIATRLTGTRLQWDGPAGRFTNSEEANGRIMPQMRAGWSL